MVQKGSFSYGHTWGKRPVYGLIVDTGTCNDYNDVGAIMSSSTPPMPVDSSDNFTRESALERGRKCRQTEEKTSQPHDFQADFLSKEAST